jgi:hypothetical protein
MPQLPLINQEQTCAASSVWGAEVSASKAPRTHGVQDPVQQQQCTDASRSIIGTDKTTGGSNSQHAEKGQGGK